MPDDLPPIPIESWNAYQADQFGTQTSAQIATLAPPTSSDSLTNPIPRTTPDLAAGPPAPDSSSPPAQPAASDLPAPDAPITAPLAPPQPTPDAPYTAPMVAGPTTGTDASPSPATTAMRSPAPAPSPISGSPDLIIKALNAADQAGVDPHLFVSLIQQESNFKPTARSPVGAAGLSQLMPATAAGLGVTDPNDPDQSLMGGARYLKQQLDHFGGDVVKALAAYNAGPGAVEKYGGVPPYPETQSYVNSILGRLAAEQANGDAQPADQPDRAVAAASPFSQASTKGADISQFGDKTLSTDEAYAACGPAAAVRFAEAYGRNPTLREATDMAKTVGWTSAQGMAGLDSEKSLMDKMGVATKVVRGPAWDAFSREAQTGNPVTISTQGHYFTADGFNPDTGAFHVGQSGLDLKHGAEWMTPAQMTSLMGPVQGGLLADNPSVPTPSTVAGTAGASQSPLDALGKLKDQTFDAIGNAAQGAASAVSGAFRTSDSGPGPQSATGEPYVGGAARPDQSTAIAQGVGNFLTQPQPFAENIVGAQTKQMQAGAGVSPYEPGAQDLTPTEQYAQARGIATGLAQTLGPEDLAARATTAGAGSLASSGDAAVQLLYDRALGGGDPGPAIEALQGWLARAAQHPEVDQTLVATKQAQLADLLKPPAMTAPANPFHLETTPGPNRELLTPQDAAAHLEDLNARHAANDSQIAQLEGAISSPSGKGEYKGIVRPNWAAGFTDGALARMAKDNGLNPYDPTWGQQARDIPGKAYYKNLNEAPQQTPAAMRVQLASLRAENEQIATAAEHAVDADAAGQPLYRVNQPAPEELPWTSYTAPGDAASAASQNPTAATQAGRFGDSGATPQGARAATVAGTPTTQGLAPNANRARAAGADAAAFDQGLPTRSARLAANDVNAGAEAPIGNEPFTRDPQGNIVPVAQPLQGVDLLQAGLDKARAEGRASPEQLDAMQAQINAMKPTSTTAAAAGGSPVLPATARPSPTNPNRWTQVAGQQPASAAPNVPGGAPPHGAPPAPPPPPGGGIPPMPPGQPASVAIKPATGAELFNEYHRGNIVGGPATAVHVAVNSAGSPAWSAGTQTAADVISGTAGWLSGSRIGLSPTGAMARMAGRSVGYTGALADSGGMFAQAARDFYANPANVANRVANPVVSGALKAQQATGAALHSSFQTVTQQTVTRSELGAAAGQQAAAEGLKIGSSAFGQRVSQLVETPSLIADQKAVAMAADIGQRAALRGEAGTFQTRMQQIASIPYVGNTLLPVVRIGSQSLAQGLERSPVGLLGTAIDVARGAAGKGPYAQGFNQVGGAVTPLRNRLINNAAGTALTAWLASKAMDGSITGNGPADPGQRAMLQSQGWQANSVWVPGRGYVDYHILGPLAVPLAIAGNYHDAVAYAKSGADPMQIGLDLAHRTASYVAGATGLRTIGDLYTIISGGAGAEKLLASLTGSTAAGFVPESAIVKAGTVAADPYARTPYLKDFPSGVSETVEQGIPGLRQNVPLKRDVLGNPVPNEQAGLGVVLPRTGGGTFNQTLDAMGQASVTIPTPPSTLQRSGSPVAIPLTPDEQARFQAIRGALLEKYIPPTVSSSTYPRLTPEAQTARVKEVVAAQTAAAHDQLLSELGAAEIGRRERLAAAQPSNAKPALEPVLSSGAPPRQPSTSGASVTRGASLPSTITRRTTP